MVQLNASVKPSAGHHGSEADQQLVFLSGSQFRLYLMCAKLGADAVHAGISEFGEGRSYRRNLGCQ